MQCISYLKLNRAVDIKVQDEIFKNAWHRMKEFRGVLLSMLKYRFAMSLKERHSVLLLCKQNRTLFS